MFRSNELAIPLDVFQEKLKEAYKAGYRRGCAVYHEITDGHREEDIHLCQIIEQLCQRDAEAFSQGLRDGLCIVPSEHGH